MCDYETHSSFPPDTPRVEDLTERSLATCASHTGLSETSLSDIKVVRLGEISVASARPTTSTAAWFLAEFIREHSDRLVRGRRVAALEAACGLAAAAAGAENAVVHFTEDNIDVSLAHASAALSAAWTRDAVHIVIDTNVDAIARSWGPFDAVFTADATAPDASRAAALACANDGKGEIFFAHTLAPREDGVDVALVAFIKSLGPDWVSTAPSILHKTDAVR